MKIYIHTDLEGATEVNSINQIFPFRTPENDAACLALTYDTNAAVKGAFDAGADEVYVLDCHGPGNNIDKNILDSRAILDGGHSHWWQSLDESFDATFFIGAHAMAGTQCAFLDHTQSSAEWFNYYINGRRVGELGQWAMVAGHFDVPLAMMSGDDAAVMEARCFFEDTECVSVKYAPTRNDAVLYDTEESRKKIYDAAFRAVTAIKNGKKFKPYKPAMPAEITLELYRSDYCDTYHKNYPWTDRIDARTIRYTVNTGLQWDMAKNK